MTIILKYDNKSFRDLSVRYKPISFKNNENMQNTQIPFLFKVFLIYLYLYIFVSIFIYKD